MFSDKITFEQKLEENVASFKPMWRNGPGPVRASVEALS
jgi:hypothetical protein